MPAIHARYRTMLIAGGSATIQPEEGEVSRAVERSEAAIMRGERIVVLRTDFDAIWCPRETPHPLMTRPQSRDGVDSDQRQPCAVAVCRRARDR